MLLQVIAKKIGDVFLRHSVVNCGTYQTFEMNRLCVSLHCKEENVKEIHIMYIFKCVSVSDIGTDAFK